jgi:tetratricopeptide (TPR) repeat protein
MRAYLCNGLNELGDYKRAAAECKDALERLQKVAPDDKLLIARLQLYWAKAEIELEHLDVSRTLLEAALAAGDDEVKLEARTTLSSLAGKSGSAADAVAEHRAALAETIKAYAPFNPRHPNIVAARHELGVALLRQGNAPAAVAELARADADAEPNEISPLELAQIRYARAEAVIRADRGAIDAARKLASEALAIYTADAPDTERYRKQRASIEAFIAKLDDVKK